MGNLPRHQDGIERRTFLLTLLKDGRVKADRIRAEDDPRLRSKTAFALIMLETGLPAGAEFSLAGTAERDVSRVTNGSDEGYLLRPRIAKSIEDFRGLFHALRGATEDTILEIDRKGHSGAEWRVCANRVWVN